MTQRRWRETPSAVRARSRATSRAVQVDGRLDPDSESALPSLSIYQQLRQQPALLASTLEELLRFDFARTPTMRVARQDTVLSGQEIRAGEAVIAWVSAANFDETAFPNALQFQPDRFLPERKASRHLALGTGMRTCLGTHLAKLEGLVFLERLLHRFAYLKEQPEHPPLYPDERFDLMLSYPVRVSFLSPLPQRVQSRKERP